MAARYNNHGRGTAGATRAPSQKKVQACAKQQKRNKLPAAALKRSGAVPTGTTFYTPANKSLCK